MVGYVDADHAGDPDEGYSTTGYVFYFAGGHLYWKSQRQTIVTLSTVEAEYVALSKGGQECVYLRDLMSSAGFEQAQATTMHEDNSGALKLANTDHYHPRTKHIGVKYHYIRHLVKENVVVVVKIATDKQRADLLTKTLGPLKFVEARSMLMQL